MGDERIARLQIGDAVVDASQLPQERHDVLYSMDAIAQQLSTAELREEQSWTPSGPSWSLVAKKQTAAENQLGDEQDNRHEQRAPHTVPVMKTLTVVDGISRSDQLFSCDTDFSRSGIALRARAAPRDRAVVVK